MRNRKRNRRFPSCETRAVGAMSPAPCPFPDVEHERADGLVGKEKTGRAIRTTLTLLSYLSLPLIVFVTFPEPLKPFSMLVAAFSAHRVLMHGGVELRIHVRSGEKS